MELECPSPRCVFSVFYTEVGPQKYSLMECVNGLDFLNCIYLHCLFEMICSGDKWKYVWSAW